MNGPQDVFDLAALRALSGARVEVGVPGGGNAWLLCLHESGSPVKGIPPRPVLESALSDNGVKDAVAELFSEAMDFALNGDPGAAAASLDAAGALAEEAVKAYFGSGNLAPNKPATMKAKRGNAPLIDTGALRASITHRVV